MGNLINAAAASSNSSFVSGSLWFVNSTGGSFQFLFSAIDATPNAVFVLYYTPTTKFINISVGDNSGSPSYAFGRSTVTTPFSTSGWKHVAFGVDVSSATSKTFKFVANATNIGSIVTDPSSGVQRSMSISMSGAAVGIPAHPDYILNTTTTTPMAQMQIWVGQYIDPTISANYAKFVSISNGTGTPASISLSHSAFGTPTFEFYGDRTAFKTNRGTGGGFSMSGTINNYTPTPSY